MDGALAYDPGDASTPPRMLLFGGNQRIIPTARELNDLWAFDGTDWLELSPPGDAPQGRRVVAHGFDEAHRRWTVFGGTIETDDLGDLWTYDAARGSWTLWQSDGDRPQARGFASATFDPIDGALWLFGGYDQPDDRALADGWTVTIR
jgi:hypothetical protein